MRGHVYKRGNTWTAVFDVGDQPRSCCVECGASSWGLTLRSRCGECGAPVEVRRERRQRSKGGFPTKAAAEAHLADRLAEIVRGALVVPSDITVGEYLSRWLEVQRSQLEPSTDERLLVTLDRGLGDVAPIRREHTLACSCGGSIISHRARSVARWNASQPRSIWKT